jgi:predicted PurR-regulated permease PerM
MVIGNILEPRIMGKGLGLSALIIFLSMTLWGWVLGPTGMILSVPLTMAMQFLFAQYKETEWIALILSDYGEKPVK